MVLRITLLFLVILSITPEYLFSAQESKTKEIVERVIKIEGNIEKPRVLFVVPKGRIWRDDVPKRKSFIQEILQPVYPGSLTPEPITDIKPARR